ncbi:dienelactone hydrolase family protein [Streptosporangium carneum]|uniref:Carboxymethylenebutenolidase n=1 Tax=Streptosporangium carneum TaxID=47481 RepID=A0A9W6IAV5_9ACTN|nr:dienelactone hydrolase family protein [Streptosporangium carneum]GLK15287.1 carboxymethylenebutenolidase [Streptosporangium carneum]
MEARTETVTVADGSFDLHLWLPEGGRGPVVLLIQEIYGVGPYIRQVAEELAGHGYVVGAPDLFWRIQPGWVSDHSEAGTAESLKIGSQFDVPHGVADSAMALTHLRALPEADGGAGVVGFCLGGSVAYLMAATVETDAVLSFYGSAVPDATGLMEKISCPLLLVFGGSDPYIPRDRVAQVEQAAAGRPNVEMYVAEQAGHAFLNHEAPQFHNPEAAPAAWESALEFLRRHVR